MIHDETRRPARRPVLLPTVLDTEEDQIARAAAGDSEAYRLIVERYDGLVFRVIEDVLHDAQMAEDVAQECFLTAHRSLASLRDPRAFKRWITTIAQNMALRARRTRIRSIVVEMPGDGLDRMAFHQSGDNADDIPDQVASRLGGTEAHGWLATLPECYKTTRSEERRVGKECRL